MSMSFWRAAALAAVFAVTTGAAAQPVGAPMPPPIAAPQDVAYPGVITLEIDATDVRRGIFRGRETVPIAGPGPITLIYPQWLPGNHGPRGPLNLFAGLEVRANGERVPRVAWDFQDLEGFVAAARDRSLQQVRAARRALKPGRYNSQQLLLFQL